MGENKETIKKEVIPTSIIPNELSGFWLIVARFYHLVNTRNLSVHFRFSRTSEAPVSEVLGRLGWKALYWSYRGNSLSVILAPKGGLVFVEHDGMDYAIDVAAVTAGRAEKLVDKILTLLPTIELKDDRVPVKFWSLGPRGPVSRTRLISAPTWEEIRENHPTKPQANLAQLATLSRPPEAFGKLILLHGKPGLGKTFFLRSLARSWKEWAKVSYIVDPDAFFNKAEYLLEVIFDTDEGQAVTLSEIGPASLNGATSAEQEKNRAPLAAFWHVLILEDSGEFLSIDARERSGQGLSRLLNITDGFVGQGIPLLAVLTTNEDITALHPAITRAGRCLANVEFAPFEQGEASEWLTKRGHTGPVGPGPHTLADLYEVLRNTQIVSSQDRKNVGFALKG